MGKDQLRRLWSLFWIFFKAGTFTFAGGLAMLPVIERDIVDRQGMMPREEFLEYATLSQTLPGVIALNCACLVGRRAMGTVGMLAAAFGATFSAFVLMIAATVLWQMIPQTGPVAGAFRGIRAASAAIVLAAAVTLGQHNIKRVFGVVIMLAAFVLVLIVHVDAPLVVLGAGIAGLLYGRMRHDGKKEER